MKFKYSFVLIFALLFCPWYIQAKDNDAETLVSPNQKPSVPKIRATRSYRYGMAGCGFGSLFFESPEEQNQRFFQVVASMADEAPYSAAYYALTAPALGPILSVSSPLGLPFLSSSVYSSTQSSAYSSGTCNCSEDEPHLAALNQEIYVAINKYQLEKETAQAAGPHLTALAKVLGCEDQVLQEFGAITQKAYGQIFEKDEPKIITEKYRFLVLNSEPLSSSCHMNF